MKRLFVEKKEQFAVKAKKLKKDIKEILNIDLSEIRIFTRYDIQGIEAKDYHMAKHTVFSEPPCDNVFEEIDLSGYGVIAVQYLPGQYDQRADSAQQCVQLLTQKEKPKIRCANIYAVKGADNNQLNTIKNYLINPVESCEASLEMPLTLDEICTAVKQVEYVSGFTEFSEKQINQYHTKHGFAMTAEDLLFVQSYFKGENRNPTETELKVIDTYWSDHCRHTTFLTELKDIKIEKGGSEIQDAYNLYKELFAEINGGREDKYPCLMDIATIAAKFLRKKGLLDDLDISDEINACSIKIKAVLDGKEEDWLVMFKNETHNHPTEIEPFGGAATCLGGAIRDPLSGRVYVYHAMRVTGCGNPLTPFTETLKGKLPQRVITKTAADGFSSYGNQIGLCTGLVSEIYHQGYTAKRMEAGFVVGAAPCENVLRQKPECGDIVMILGGETGRDGCGGATGSSKAHTAASVEQCGAEVQKGNPLTERKLQRLFRKKEVTRLIKRCNDFGAGGVSVAIGELADSIEIDLNAIPKKYSGLSGTELAISESQERMAVVIASDDVQKFIDAAKEENLKATAVARVTDSGRMKMTFNGKTIVDISREFLNTNGVKQSVNAVIREEDTDYIFTPSVFVREYIRQNDYNSALLSELRRFNVCSQKGLNEMFDGTIGSGSVYMPYGGKYQLTPVIAMAAKIPSENRYTDICTVSSYACYPDLAEKNAFAGGLYAVLCSVAKLVACGADRKMIRLTMQEYFKRLHKDEYRWGQPLSALLGALYAQTGLQTAAIGGKDSMSGSYENLDVPPTVISFALAVCDANLLITNVLRKAGQKLYMFSPKCSDSGICDFEYVNRLYDSIHQNIISGNIDCATVSEHGGAACAVVKSCMGNGLGFKFNKNSDLFSPLLGTIIISAKDIRKLDGFENVYIGETLPEGEDYYFDNEQIYREQAQSAWSLTLEKIFPLNAEAAKEAENINYVKKASEIIICPDKFARPNVFLPIFPGTNCEYDTAKRFLEQGAKVTVFVVKNLSPQEIEQSVEIIAKYIDQSQITVFSGGFSGGDEPDGSGKFIATTIRNPRICESITKLYKQRKGLILGICNGFQALIKMGLLPYGEFTPQNSDSPTLTFNNISRHISSLCQIRVASDKSPWLYGVNTGEVYTVPVSHGEGRFYCNKQQIEQMINNGQIATQYADFEGNAAVARPFNPNGSYYAVEGITSPCGRIFGKMGHTERYENNLYKNIDGRFDMKVFESGIKYFK